MTFHRIHSRLRNAQKTGILTAPVCQHAGCVRIDGFSQRGFSFGAVDRRIGRRVDQAARSMRIELLYHRAHVRYKASLDHLTVIEVGLNG